MAIEDPKLAEALEQVRVALEEMGSGNPEPYIACWADSDDATLFGAWGPIDKGFRRLAKTFRWVGTRFRSGRLVPEHSVASPPAEISRTPSASSAGGDRGRWAPAPHDGDPRHAHLPALRRYVAARASPRRLPAPDQRRDQRRRRPAPGSTGLTRRLGIQYVLIRFHHT